MRLSKSPVLSASKAKPISQIRKALSKLNKLLRDEDFGRGKELWVSKEAKNLSHIRFFLAGALPFNVAPEVVVEVDGRPLRVDFMLDKVALEVAFVTNTKRKKTINPIRQLTELKKLAMHCGPGKRGALAIFDFRDTPISLKEVKEGIKAVINDQGISVSRNFWILYYYRDGEGDRCRAWKVTTDGSGTKSK